MRMTSPGIVTQHNKNQKSELSHRDEPPITRCIQVKVVRMHLELVNQETEFLQLPCTSGGQQLPPMACMKTLLLAS